MIITHNMGALNAQRQLGINTKSKAKTAEKLASGYRINRASDDAAGLSISEKMRRQIRGLKQGVENTEAGVSLCQVADGALAEVSDMLHRITELSVQAANGTNSESDRQAIQEEINQILEEIDKISDTTSFNELHLFKDITTPNPITVSLSNTKTKSINSNEDFIRDSLNITGTPEGFTSGTYTINANNQGLTIDGTTIAWSEVKDINGDSFDSNALTDSVYQVQFKGLDIKFETKIDMTFEDVINAVDGTKFQIAEKNIQKEVVSISDIKVVPGTETDDLLQGNPLLGGETLYIKADDTGISIMQYSYSTPYTQMTWAQMGIDDWSNVSGKTFTFSDSKTGVTFTGTIEADSTKEDVIESMNGINFKWDYIDRDTSSNSTLVLKGITVPTDGGSITNKLSDVQLSDMWFHQYGGTDFFYKEMGYTTPSEIIDGVELSISLIKNSADQFALKVTSAKGAEKVIPINSSKTSEFSQDGYNLVRFGGFSNSNENFDILTVGTSSESAKNTLLEQYVGQEIATVTLPSPYKYSIVPKEVTYTEIYINDVIKNENNNAGTTPIPPSQGTDSNGKLCLWIQSGCDAGDGVMLEMDKMSTEILGIKDVNVTSVEGAEKAMTSVEGALKKLSANRSKIGAQQNRLEHTITNENNIIENTTSAESRIRDADMAEEMVKLSKENILAQACQSMLAQANQSTQGVLKLLQ